MQKKFSLLKYFSVISLLAILGIAAATVYFSRQMLVSQLVQAGESANSSLAESIANAMWTDNADFVKTVSETNGDRIRALPGVAKLHTEISDLVRNIPVLKVKIYNTKATTIYSSEAAQIGESKSDSEGFLVSLAEGIPVSKMSQRGTFSAFSGQVSDVALVETYVPILDRQNNEVEAVFELYSDVTALTRRIDDAVLKMGLILAGLFVLLYGVLLAAMQIANRTILRQRAELEKNSKNLDIANKAMMREMSARQRIENQLTGKDVDQKAKSILPKVREICKDISRLYIEIGGPGKTDDVKSALSDWTSNETHGPHSIPIFISFLAKHLQDEQQVSFRSRARELIKL